MFAYKEIWGSGCDSNWLLFYYCHLLYSFKGNLKRFPKEKSLPLDLCPQSSGMLNILKLLHTQVSAEYN